MTIGKRSLLVGLGVVALQLAAGTAKAQSALDNILKAKKIRIGIPPDFAPYGAPEALR